MSEARSISPSRYVALRSDHVVAQALWIIASALLTAVGAQLEIPHQPVPYTLQTFFVILAGGLLGKRNGFLSMVLYLGMGVSGLPVFSGASFGLARLVGPTGGYLLSFPLAAYIIGYLLSFRPGWMGRANNGLAASVLRYGWTSVAMISGLLCIFLLGTLQLNAVYFHNWQYSFQSGFLIFSWWDVLKLVAAVAIWREFGRR